MRFRYTYLYNRTRRTQQMELQTNTPDEYALHGLYGIDWVITF